ncbi:MAG: TonB-dependent receptor [Myxococcales bacterium]|nr:TonB-dependent receptor [Myxococcales bacterium]
MKIALNMPGNFPTASSFVFLSVLLVAGPALGQDEGASAEVPPGEGEAPEAPPAEEDDDTQGLDDELDMLQEQVEVTTATKSMQKVEEAPAVITVVTREQIERWGYRSVAEVLSHLAGFFVQDDHVLPNVAVRGIIGGLRAESGILKVMIDGRSVAFRSTSGVWLGPELIPLTAVESIEIVRGPASALYGADAFLGVINVITRAGKDQRGADLTTGVSLTGKNLGGDMDASLSTRLGAVEVLLGARVHSEDRSGLSLPGSSPAPQIPDYSQATLTSSGQRMFSGTGLLKLIYHLGEKSRLTLAAGMSTIERVAEFADWQQLANGIDAQGHSRKNQIALVMGYVDLGATFALNEQLELNASATYFTGGPRPSDRIDVGSDTYWVRREFGFSGCEVSLGARYQPIPSLQLMAGTDLFYDDEALPSMLHVLQLSVGGLKAGDIRESTSVRQGHKALFNPGAYLQALWQSEGGRIGLTGGFRFDHHNIYGGQPSGRAALVVKALSNLHLKLVYASAFKAPSPQLLYGVPLRSGDIIGNPDLEPQYVHTLEGQVLWSPSEVLHLSTDVGYSLVMDQAEFTQQGANKVARNISELGALSWEAEAELHWKDWLRAYLNLTLVWVVRDRGEEGYAAELVGWRNGIYPPLTVNLGVMGRLPKLPLRLSVEASFRSSRRASDSNILAAGTPYELAPTTLLSGALTFTGLQLLPYRATTLMLIGRNLLGSAGPDPGFSGIDYPLAPRTLLLLWKQEF